MLEVLKMENGLIDDENNKSPALLAVVEGNRIGDAFKYFQNSGKNKLYFYSNSKQIKNAGNKRITHVYFKVRDILFKESNVVAKADFIEITNENPVEFRLQGSESEEGLYYYGFTNLRKLNCPIELSEMRYFKPDGTGSRLLNSTPGATIIIDPEID
ncbi:hypothetical protein J4458_03305 [Candidatus Woesearchaeota archaeon]|nr:hypothetical protein [Candidatus Woesearchaeota archaeon]